MEKTITVPESREVTENPDDNQTHIVHLQCQEEAPFKIALCGFLLDDDERNDESELPRCQECWALAQTFTCPVCGLIDITKLPRK